MPAATTPERRRRGGCPLCGGASVEAYAPFCGRGCRDRDLLAWLGEDRRIPGRPAPRDDAEA